MALEAYSVTRGGEGLAVRGNFLGPNDFANFPNVDGVSGFEFISVLCNEDGTGTVFVTPVDLVDGRYEVGLEEIVREENIVATIDEGDEFRFKYRNKVRYRTHILCGMLAIQCSSHTLISIVTNCLRWVKISSVAFR
jgi:hypothetical protein